MRFADAHFFGDSLSFAFVTRSDSSNVSPFAFLHGRNGFGEGEIGGAQYSPADFFGHRSSSSLSQERGRAPQNWRLTVQVAGISLAVKIVLQIFVLTSSFTHVANVAVGLN